MKSNQNSLAFFIITAISAFAAHTLELPSALSVLLGAAAGFVCFRLIGSSTSVAVKTTPSSSQDPSVQTLYVGNLPYRANEKDVKDLFAEHGEVTSVRLMKDKRTGKRRGFGFVSVNNKDADKVIAALNNAEYMQRSLKVRVANDPKHPTEGSAE